MPFESLVFVSCVVVAFTTFMLSVAYAHHVTVTAPARSR